MLRLRILLDGLGLLLLDSLGHHWPAKKCLVSTGLDLWHDGMAWRNLSANIFPNSSEPWNPKCFGVYYDDFTNLTT